MNITRAQSIPGWMSQDELTFLAVSAEGCKSIAEIGSWRGRSARAMADNTSGVVYCVDPWIDTAYGIDGWWSSEDNNRLMNQPGWLWREFSKHLDDHLNRRVFPVRMMSLEAAAYLKQYVSFDMIFIDADHSEEAVLADIEAWMPLLNNGGMLCGHDYDYPNTGVKAAIDKLFPNARKVDTIWIA